MTLESIFDKIGTGDVIEVTVKKPTSSEKLKRKLKVGRKSKGRAGKPTEYEKVTLTSVSNPGSAKYYLYKKKSRKGGKYVTLAFSNMPVMVEGAKIVSKK